MKNKANLFNRLFIGFFLVLWSVNGYFIGADIFKNLILLGGLMIIYSCVFSKQLVKRKVWIEVTILSVLFFGIVVTKAFLQNQETTTPTILLFGVIDLLLFSVGYLIGKNQHIFGILSRRNILLIMGLSLVGILFFFVFQNQIYAESNVVGRGAGEEGVNVIGIAYTNALIFILLYNINRSVYKNDRFVYYGTFLLMILCAFVIMQTQSRGAMIYLFVIFLIFSISKISYKNFISVISKGILYLCLVSVAFIVFLRFNPSYQVAVDGFTKRLESLSGSIQGTRSDNSINARSEKYDDFFRNYSNYVLLGKTNYVPYPHNIFIEIIQRFGVVFGLPILLLIAVSFANALKVAFNKHSGILLVLFAMVFLFSFFQSLSSMSLEMNRSLWLSMGVISGSVKVRWEIGTNL